MAKIDDMKAKALSVVDGHYARLIAAEIGPLGALHALKVAQAEVGIGSLIADEDDRAAILANASAMADRLSSIEAERRAAKQAIRSAGTVKALTAAVLGLPENKSIMIHLG